MAEQVICDLCGRELPLDRSYVVRIDVFADPSMPALSAEQLAAMDFDKTLAELLDQMKHLSAEDLQDSVHRRFEYRLCTACQREYLSNPLGKPRRIAAGTN